jgi:hypothetical protein
VGHRRCLSWEELPSIIVERLAEPYPAPMPWQYKVVDWDPKKQRSERECLGRRAAEGWHLWDASSGHWTVVDGRRVKRYYLRRPMPGTDEGQPCTPPPPR